MNKELKEKKTKKASHFQAWQETQAHAHMPRLISFSIKNRIIYHLLLFLEKKINDALSTIVDDTSFRNLDSDHQGGD